MANGPRFVVPGLAEIEEESEEVRIAAIGVTLTASLACQQEGALPATQTPCERKPTKAQAHFAAGKEFQVMC